jgi:hypothetical protein
MRGGCDQLVVNDKGASPSPLEAFVRPILGLPAWGVKQGYGSFLTFDFGEPTLKVEDRRHPEKGLRHDAYVKGQWHLWIYCCCWRAIQDEVQLAWSEDSRADIDRAAAILNGQKLLGIEVTPADGRSVFTFDLGGSLETWPYGDDPTTEQWMIFAGGDVFAYRADGAYQCGPADTAPGLVRWLPLQPR